MMGSEGGNFNISISRSLENAFPTHFFTSKDILPMADKHHFSPLISWFSDKMQEIPSPKSVHKSRQQIPQSCVVCGSYFFFFFCNQTWPCHLVMLSSDFSFLCMSKHCSITVINSQSTKFTFYITHFSLAQLHEMSLLSLNNEAKQKLHVATSLSWFHWTSIFQHLYFYFVPNCFAIYFQCVILFRQTTIKQLDQIGDGRIINQSELTYE